MAAGPPNLHPDIRELNNGKGSKKQTTNPSAHNLGGKVHFRSGGPLFHSHEGPATALLLLGGISTAVEISLRAPARARSAARFGVLLPSLIIPPTSIVPVLRLVWTRRSCIKCRVRVIKIRGRSDRNHRRRRWKRQRVWHINRTRCTGSCCQGRRLRWRALKRNAYQARYEPKAKFEPQSPPRADKISSRAHWGPRCREWRGTRVRLGGESQDST